MIKEFDILTRDRYELVNITSKVEEIIEQGSVGDGLVLVFVPHSTAGIILTEDEPGLKNDWLCFLEKIVSGFKFEHNRIDDNADSHILSGILGQARTLPIRNGKTVRGTWQDIFLVELDGPRTRRVIIKLI
ncbi:hypothetical protein AMJ47_01150 [Parcubacteria bacterium DG_72]|nr:MAG: hypothetical protein AMJ47_01150 [Parcubacteria bacterium DG_72]